MRIVCTAAAGLFALGAAAPAFGQVIEIDSAGVAQTFDGPTQFTATEAVAITSGQASPHRVRDATTELGEAARVYGLDPALLRAVAWQESRGRMSAVSPKGALGVMQLMPSTAAELGVNPTVMSDNIRGGALYLRRQLDRFGSVPLALAAYNAGPGAVLRYRGIPPYRETRDYVARIMARWRPGTAAPPNFTPTVEVAR